MTSDETTAPGSTLDVAPDAAPGEGSDPTPEPFVPDYQIQLRGFATEEDAHQLGNTLRGCIGALASYFDLSLLSGVTVGWDYDEALQSVDRGYEGARPLSRTATEAATGVAMCANVLRDGQPRCHLVFNAGVLSFLLDTTHELFRPTLYMVAHELGHVEEHAARDRAMPGTLLQHTFDNAYDAYLFEIAEACWTEYAACRLSAFVDPSQGVHLAETMLATLEAANALETEIFLYRHHGDIDRLLVEGVRAVGNLMKFAAYFIGHAHGLGQEPTAAAAEAWATVQASQYGPVLTDLVATLDATWDAIPTWDGLSAFAPLQQVAHDGLRAGGLILHRMPEGGLYVDVP